MEVRGITPPISVTDGSDYSAIASENIQFSELSTHDKLLCRLDLDLLVTPTIHLAAADYTPVC
jgi:hypothetical protein